MSQMSMVHIFFIEYIECETALIIFIIIKDEQKEE